DPLDFGGTESGWLTGSISEVRHYFQGVGACPLPLEFGAARVSRKRVLLGLFIIAGGVCASLPFRKAAPVPAIAASSSAASSASTSSPLADIAFSKGPPAPSPYLDDGSQQEEVLTGRTPRSKNPTEEIASVPREE